MNDLITIRGKRLFVETAGKSDAPALLYLHGGPGIGAYDFMYFQKERLSKHLYVIAFDQRGVLRSDPLEEDEPFHLQDLIEDCEVLRETLGIKRWSVLGHSFGGYIGLLYANAYPDSVASLLFESPTFDLGLSARSLLRGAAKEHRELGNEQLAFEALSDAEEPSHSPEQLSELCFGKYLSALGDHRENLYTYGPDKFFFNRIISESPFPQQWWGKQQRYQNKLFSEGRLYDSLMPLLPNINCRALLMKGAHDHVTCEIHVQSFMRDITKSELKIFEYSGHMPRYEEPDLYAKVVTDFVHL